MLNPQFSNDNIVDGAVDVLPSVHLVVPAEHQVHPCTRCTYVPFNKLHNVGHEVPIGLVKFTTNGRGAVNRNSVLVVDEMTVDI